MQRNSAHGMWLARRCSLAAERGNNRSAVTLTQAEMAIMRLSKLCGSKMQVGGLCLFGVRTQCKWLQISYLQSSRMRRAALLRVESQGWEDSSMYLMNRKPDLLLPQNSILQELMFN